MNEFGGAIDRREQIRLTFTGPDFTDVVMQVTDRVVFEGWFVRRFWG